MKDPVTWLYPPIEPYNTGRLQVSPIHEIYFEESGNPSGKPVIFLMELTRRFPDVTWRVIWGGSVGTSDYSVYGTGRRGDSWSGCTRSAWS